MRRWAADARQAESLYIVVVALVLVVVMLAGQWAWVVWGAQGGAATLWYFAAQVAMGLVVGIGCLLGWRPPIHVRADADGLTIRRGAEMLALPYDAIMSAERAPAALYHRHWRRYAATRAFVNRLGDEVLLLRSTDGPVVLALPAADLARLDAHLTARLETAPRLVRAA